MANGYSLDLREKVLSYLEKNSDKKAASALFEIGIATVYRWAARKKKLGHVKPYRRAYAYKKLDDERLRKYVEKTPDQFLSEIAKEFAVTPQTIFYALKRIKFTRKKKLRSTGKEMQKKELCLKKL